MTEPFYPNVEPLTIKKHSWLWVKFYWYKWVRRKDILGFFAGIPIIRTEYLKCRELKSDRGIPLSPQGGE